MAAKNESSSEKNEEKETTLPSGYHYGWYTMEQLAEYYDQLIGKSQKILMMLLVMAMTMIMMTQTMLVMFTRQNSVLRSLRYRAGEALLRRRPQDQLQGSPPLRGAAGLER